MTLKVVRTGKQKKGKSIKKPKDIIDEMKFLQKKDREHFYVVHLSAKMNIIGKELISIGTLTHSAIHPREVFKGAILSNSACIICVHNHPSGDPTPSEDDLEITARLKKIGEIIGIPVQDHIIIGTNSHKSIILQSNNEHPSQVKSNDRDIYDLFDEISECLGFCQNTFRVISKFEQEEPEAKESINAASIDDTYGWILNEAQDKIIKAKELLDDQLYEKVKSKLSSVEKAVV